MKLKVNGDYLHEVFFNSAFYSKTFTLMIVSEPDALASKNNFLLFTIIVLAAVIACFVFMVSNASLIF